MKKIIGIAACITCLLSIIELQPATVNAKAAYTAKIYATSLNVRGEPAANAAVTGSLHKGYLLPLPMKSMVGRRYSLVETSGGLRVIV